MFPVFQFHYKFSNVPIKAWIVDLLGPCIQTDNDRRIYCLLRICVIVCTFIHCAWETDLSFPGCFSWWTDLGCAQLYYYYQVGIWRYCSGFVLKTFEWVFMWQYFLCKIVPNCSEKNVKSIGDITIVPTVNHTLSLKNIVSPIVYIIYLFIYFGGMVLLRGRGIQPIATTIYFMFRFCFLCAFILKVYFFGYF